MTISAPQVESISVEKLTVDPSVQRSVDKLRVGRIAKDYQPAALGTITVSRREDGVCHVIDGQHRVMATIEAGHGDQEVTCLVYTGLTRAEEAAMFRRLNNTRTVLPVDKFRVRVVEGDPVAVTLNKILNQHGWTVMTSKAPGTFAAVTALEGVYGGKLNGEGDVELICDELISIITESWGHDADGVRGEIVGGLGALLLRYNTRVDLSKLVAELGKYPSGPRGLVGKAKGLRDYRGGKLPDAVAEIAVELLNKGRRTNKLPDWRSHA